MMLVHQSTCLTGYRLNAQSNSTDNPLEVALQGVTYIGGIIQFHFIFSY